MLRWTFLTLHFQTNKQSQKIFILLWGVIPDKDRSSATLCPIASHKPNSLQQPCRRHNNRSHHNTSQTTWEENLIFCHILLLHLSTVHIYCPAMYTKLPLVCFIIFLLTNQFGRYYIYVVLWFSCHLVIWFGSHRSVTIETQADTSWHKQLSPSTSLYSHNLCH